MAYSITTTPMEWTFLMIGLLEKRQFGRLAK